MNAIRRYLRSHTTFAFRSSIHRVGKEWQMSRHHRAAVKQAPRFLENLPIQLNLGSGPNVKPGWLNIDLSHPKADLLLDLCEPWPFPDESVSFIYSEHALEHFEIHREVPHFLSESLRVLKAGGVFDVGVPDTAWPMRAYGNVNDGYWRLAKDWHPANCETQMDHINYHFRQGVEHKFAWDEETLMRTFERHGLQNILRREFDPLLDTESRRAGTLYMRGNKRL